MRAHWFSYVVLPPNYRDAADRSYGAGALAKRMTESFMNYSMFNLLRFVSKSTSLALAVCIAWTIFAKSAAAQTSPDPTVTYHIDFGTDYNMMLNPSDPVAQHFAMWKTPVQMVSLRSAPFMRITNDATSAMQLTKLRLDIGDPDYLFDSFAFFEQPDDGAAQLTSHTDITFGGDMKPYLEIEFPSGLNPGDSFTFQVRIAKLGATSLADYESSLWHKDDSFSPNRLDNALVSVTYHQLFSSGLDLTVPMTPVRLFEYPLANATFPIDANGASGSSIVLPNMHEMLEVGFERFSQTVQVPEPGSLGLAALGIAGAGCFWRRRRSTRACAA